jgi:hypothetical protein
LAALVRKQLTQPFEPIVESDELTANFDETSTSANLHGLRLADMDFGFEEEGPSEDWVALAGSVSGHPPNRAWPRPQRMNIKPKSIHVPDFKMQPSLKPHLQNMSPAPQASPAPQHSPGSSSKSLIHVKLIQARALHVRSSSARPYETPMETSFHQEDFSGPQNMGVRSRSDQMETSEAISREQIAVMMSTLAEDNFERNQTEICTVCRFFCHSP